MPQATYTLEMELSYNTWTNITADWQIAAPLTIERGIEPGERVARIGRMSLTLYNPDGRYTPGHANARPGFNSGIGVRLKANDGTTTRTLFYGRLARITESVRTIPNPALQDTVQIEVEDDIAALRRVPVGVFNLILNATPRAVINAIVNASFTPPGLFGYWRLGHNPQSKLGTAKLPGDYTGKNFDLGQSVFPWVGDTWPPSLPADAAMRDVCDSEFGYFAIAADGTPIFADRHNRPKHITVDATLTGGLAGIEVERSEARLINDITVIVHPRTVGGTPDVLWQSGKSIRVNYNQPVEMEARFIDPNQQVAWIGAQSLIVPIAGVDFTATDKADGTGTDLTANVLVTLEAGATSALLRLEILKTKKKPRAFIHGLRLRGYPLRAFLPVSITKHDDTSLLTHGHHPQRFDMSLQDDAGVARDVAGALISNRKDPRAWITVTVEAVTSAALLTQALAREVGDRLSVTDSALALSSVGCFIESIRHDITHGGASHRVTWRTSPTDLHAYWILGQTGYEELGSKTRLGY